MGYYETLHLIKSATSEDIKKSYRKLALQHHPDKNNGSKLSEIKFKEISYAYQILSDPVQRRQYDLTFKKPTTNPSKSSPFTNPTSSAFGNSRNFSFPNFTSKSANNASKTKPRKTGHRFIFVDPEVLYKRFFDIPDGNVIFETQPKPKSTGIENPQFSEDKPVRPGKTMNGNTFGQPDIIDPFASNSSKFSTRNLPNR